MSTRPSLVGKKFGKWVVTKKIGLLPNRGLHTYYDCKCKCGNRTLLPRTNIVRKKTLSCRQCANKAKRGQYRVRLSAVFSRIKRSAAVRNMRMDITHDYVLSLMEKQKWKCALTKLPLRVGYKNGKSSFSTASLDRINSSIGYIIGNVQWVYKPINMMKWKLTNREFVRLCKLVVENSK